MRLALPAALVVFGALTLACAGGGATSADGPSIADPEPAADPDPSPTVPTAPVWLAASSRTPWPLADVGDTVLAALDDDPATTWSAADGEVATLFAAGGPAASVRVQTDAASVEVRAFKPSRLKPPAPSAWQRHEVQGGVVDASLETPQTAVEIRVPGGGRVSGLSLGVPAAVSPRPLSQLSAIGGKDGAGNALVDLDAVRLGEVDLDACRVRKPFPPPDADFQGDCTRTDAGLVLKGALPYVGDLDETVAVRQVTPCLWIVDGWPLASCQ